MFFNWFNKKPEQTKKELSYKQEESFYQKIKQVEGINKEKYNNKNLIELIARIKAGLILNSENGFHYYSKCINDNTYQPFFLKSLFRSLKSKEIDEYRIVNSISKAIGPEFKIDMTYDDRLDGYEIVITWN